MIKLLKDSRKQRASGNLQNIQVKSLNHYINEPDLERIGNNSDFVALRQEDHRPKKNTGHHQKQDAAVNNEIK